MSATLTITSASLAADGKTLTINVGGIGTGPLLPATGVTGFTVKAGGLVIAQSSAGSSASAVTISLASYIDSSQTVTLDYTPGNLTDSAATPNTLVSSSANAVINNSTVSLIHRTDWTDGTHSNTSAGSAGTTTGAGDNWIDNNGGIYYVNNNLLALVPNTDGTPAADGSYLLRPLSETNTDQQAALYFPGTAFANGFYLLLRYQGSNTGYLLGTDGGTLALYKDLSGALTLIRSVSLSINTAHNYRIIASAVGVNPTTVSAACYDLTSNNVVTQVSGTDSSAALQNAGQIGLMWYEPTSTSKIQKMETASLTPPVTATAYTLTGPSSGTVSTASTNFTVQLTPSNGQVTSAVTVTPSASVVTGRFTPASVTFPANTPGASATFTFTPSGTGTATISTTNSAGLSNPSSVTYTSTSGPFVIAVNSPACKHSPGNWSGDTGRGGSQYRQSWTNGAYGMYVWTTTSGSPTATLLLTNATSGSTISYYLDGKLTDGVSVPSSGGISISGLATGAHTLFYVLRQSQQTGRWVSNGTGANVFRDAGLQVDASSTPGIAPAFNGNWVLEIGDSITEGIAANNGSDDNLCDYSFLCGQGYMSLGYDYGVSACGYSGWLRPGDSGGDVPAYYTISGSSGGTGGTYSDGSSRWNKLDGLNSLLDSNGHLSAYGSTGQEPSAITINYGTNEALTSSSVSDTQASVMQCLAAIRGAAPTTWIIVIVPFGLYSTAIYSNGVSYVNAVKAGVAAYQAVHSSDTKTVLLDLGVSASNALASSLYGAAVHPNILGHAYVAPQVGQFVVSKLYGASSSQSGIATGNIIADSSQLAQDIAASAVSLAPSGYAVDPNATYAVAEYGGDFTRVERIGGGSEAYKIVHQTPHGFQTDRYDANKYLISSVFQLTRE